jgi:hypothetical protein
MEDVRGNKFGPWKADAILLRCMSLLLANRVISRAPNNQVAIRSTRTSNGRQDRLAHSRMTPKATFGVVTDRHSGYEKSCIGPVL